MSRRHTSTQPPATQSSQRARSQSASAGCPFRDKGNQGDTVSAEYVREHEGGVGPAFVSDVLFASMNEGPLSTPVLRRDGVCVREVVARRAWMPAELGPDGGVAAPSGAREG